MHMLVFVLEFPSGDGPGDLINSFSIGVSRPSLVYLKSFSLLIYLKIDELQFFLRINDRQNIKKHHAKFIVNKKKLLNHYFWNAVQPTFSVFHVKNFIQFFSSFSYSHFSAGKKPRGKMHYKTSVCLYGASSHEESNSSHEMGEF